MPQTHCSSSLTAELSSDEFPPTLLPTDLIFFQNLPQPGYEARNPTFQRSTPQPTYPIRELGSAHQSKEVHTPRDVVPLGLWWPLEFWCPLPSFNALAASKAGHDGTHL